VLRDVYNFYKNSPKRKHGLETTAKDKVIAQLADIMEAEIAIGEQELKKIPSLRLKRWCATRWLGRSECLTALCKAYEYILEHLLEFSKNSTEKAKDRGKARELYQELTTYNTFLFIFFYRDLTAMLAWTSQLLQARDIQIRDVGRCIMTLCGRLQGDYHLESLMPNELYGDGEADNMMTELFGKDFNCKSQNCNWRLITQISMSLKHVYNLNKLPKRYLPHRFLRALQLIE